MTRAALVVDGLNLYHSINRRPNLHGYKWLNLAALANALIMPSKERVVDVCFCTSSPTWNLNKQNRHAALVKVYEDLGIRIVPGKLQGTKRRCEASCGQEFKVFEEKQTDSNVAIEVIKLGLTDACDKVFLLTADSDQVPTIRFFRNQFPAKELVAVVPFGEYAEDLRAAATSQRQITMAQLKASVLSDPFCTKSGEQIAKPATWCAPAPA